jgi:hypothetical protein
MYFRDLRVRQTLDDAAHVHKTESDSCFALPSSQRVYNLVNRTANKELVMTAGPQRG